MLTSSKGLLYRAFGMFNLVRECRIREHGSVLPNPGQEPSEAKRDHHQGGHQHLMKNLDLVLLVFLLFSLCYSPGARICRLYISTASLIHLEGCHLTEHHCRWQYLSTDLLLSISGHAPRAPHQPHRKFIDRLEDQLLSSLATGRPDTSPNDMLHRLLQACLMLASSSFKDSLSAHLEPFRGMIL